MALNIIAITGRFVRDSELKRTTNGTALTNFCLAVQEDFKNKDTGMYDVDFIDCVAFKTTAETISKYFKKGTLATVIGRLKINSWEDKNGNKRSKPIIKVNNIYFSESKKGNTDSYVTEEEDFEEIQNEEEELPF